MHTYRTRFKKEIVCEFLPPARKTKINRVIIFCSGTPGVPYKKDVMEFFSKKGYWVFHPRYRGTWESGGRFLKDSPEKDILDVIQSLPKGFKDIWSGKRFSVKADQLFIVGNSFGGPAAILLSGRSDVTKSIALAPVADWQAPDQLRNDAREYRFTREAFGEAYRFSDRDWQKLSKGRFYNPAKELHRINGKKLLIIHAKDDDIVAFGPVQKFAKKAGAGLITLKNGGHLSTSLLMQERFYKKFQQFTKKS